MSEFLATSPALPGEAPTVEGRLADIMAGPDCDIVVSDYKLSQSDKARVIAALRGVAQGIGPCGITARKIDEWELAKFLCEKVALEDFDRISRTKYLGDAKAILQFLAAASPAQPSWQPSPEAIAAVIDPVAFDPISLTDTHPSWDWRREAARATAAQILMLTPSVASTACATPSEPAKGHGYSGPFSATEFNERAWDHEKAAKNGLSAGPNVSYVRTFQACAVALRYAANHMKFEADASSVSSTDKSGAA